MSKHKDKRSCCKYEYSNNNCCNPCSSGNNMMNGIFGGTGCGLWEAIIFWLIACGAGLLNNNSILIILLFLLYGWCGDGCGNSFGW
ncbi:MAG: hypothetical protein E7213_07455 [Clostridium sp.]|nr:hypothetical protein [Clostridium sp.]